MTILDHVHGVAANRCDHPACRAAVQRYNKRWRHERANGGRRLVDAEPVRLHLATLLGQGMSLRSIAGMAGVSAAILSRIRHGEQTRVRPGIGAKVLAVQPGVATRTYGEFEPFVPRVGTVRRLQALLALGWTHKALTARCGRHTAPLLSQKGRWVTRATHDAVAAMYRDLCTQPGPSDDVRRRAARLGYLPPVFWDDIDLDTEPDYGGEGIA